MKGLLLFCALVLTFSAPASAGVLKGKLTGRKASTYKLFALERNGRSSLARISSKGAFSVSVRRGATLHLVNAAGRYAGPVVSARGTKAHVKLTGRSGAAREVKVRNGFAVTDAKAAALFDRQSVAFSASRGTRGSGKLGLVRVSRKLHPALHALGGDKEGEEEEEEIEQQPGDDEDKDGIANTLDVDADGNGELDVTEDAPKPEADFQPRSASTLRGFLATGLNAHLAAVTEDAIDEFIRSALILGFGVRKNSDAGAPLTAVNVDCLGLPYCTPPNGTATLRADVVRDKEGTLWTDYDPDGNGLPNLAPQQTDPQEPYYMGVRPRVTRAGLHPGDTILFKMTSGTGTTSVPVVLPFFFVTVPALKEYSSGQTSGVINYPATADTPGSSQDKAILLESSSVKLVFWKPQRPPIEGAEKGSLIDMGHLDYKLSLTARGSTSVMFCKPEDFSAPSATLQVSTTPLGYAIFSDTADDVSFESGTPLSFTLNAAACLERWGVATAGRGFGIDINADSKAGDETSQTVYFQLP